MEIAKVFQDDKRAFSPTWGIFSHLHFRKFLTSISLIFIGTCYGCIETEPVVPPFGFVATLANQLAV
jgi:hypothetical protein